MHTCPRIDRPLAATRAPPWTHRKPEKRIQQRQLLGAAKTDKLVAVARHGPSAVGRAGAPR